LTYYLFVCSMVLAALSIGMFKRRLNVVRSGGRAQGHVVGHEKREIDDSPSFHPTFSFVDHDGVQHNITSNAGWSVPRPPVGTKIYIRYHRLNPELAFIDSFYHFWFWPLVLAGFAAALFFAAWYPNSCLNHPDLHTCNWGSMPEL